VAATPFAYEGRERVFYRVLQGDVIDRVASAFGVTRDELVAWNALDPGARLQAGMSLQVYVPKGTNLERVACLREGEVRALVIGSPEFIDHFEAQQGRKRMQVLVREGDTLRSIGSRYGLSVGSMERINRRSNRDPLAAGERVVVYASTTTSQPSSEPSAPSPLEAADPPHPELLPAAYEVTPATP
jgi:membrane-bound lytic murein transglycosylase D